MCDFPRRIRREARMAYTPRVLRFGGLQSGCLPIVYIGYESERARDLALHAAWQTAEGYGHAWPNGAVGLVWI